MSVNKVATAGFTEGAGAYERARPGYPAEAVATVVSAASLSADSLVADVAAGTGKLTRLLLGDWRVLAVEPVAAMGAGLRAAVAGVPVVAGAAEALPLPDSSVDLVTVAQGFHWFDAPAAFAECTRVLRPGGVLALLFNERDGSVEWVRRFREVIVAHAGGVPYERGRDWAAEMAAAGFTAVTHERFDNLQVVDRAAVVERAASTSFVGALPPEPRQACLDEVAGLVAHLAEPFPFPHHTEVTIGRRAG